MPGRHPEGSIGDCIESVLEDNPELDEESAARICNAELKAELSAEQKTALIEVEKAIAELDTVTRAQLLGQHLDGAIETPEAAGQKSVTAVGDAAPITGKAVPDVDPDNPPEEFADAMAAEDFIIYGKASIEKLDSGGENSDVREVLDMDALEQALERFFASEKAPGIISLGHDDLPVGRPLPSYELDEPTAIEVDGETFEFDAGDELTTHVDDADGDGRRELWMVGDLANDTDIARKARLGVLLGELDGFSVTIGRKATAPESGGRRVTELDLFSVTLAPNEFIANKGSEFDLAAFKAEMDRYAPTTRADDATDLPPVAEELVRDLEQFFETL